MSETRHETNRPAEMLLFDRAKALLEQKEALNEDLKELKAEFTEEHPDLDVQSVIFWAGVEVKKAIRKKEKEFRRLRNMAEILQLSFDL